MTLFNAPYTELDIITPTEGVSADDIEPLVKYAADLCNDEVKQGKHMHKDGKERENYGAAWGRVVGQDVYFYLGGWLDVKVNPVLSCVRKRQTDAHRADAYGMGRDLGEARKCEGQGIEDQEAPQASLDP